MIGVDVNASDAPRRDPAPRARRRSFARAPAFRSVEAQIRARLIEAVGGASFRMVAERVSLHPESVRRALRDGIIPLELVIGVCREYRVSAEWILFGRGSRKAASGVAAPDAAEPPLALCERLLENLKSATGYTRPSPTASTPRRGSRRSGG